MAKTYLFFDIECANCFGGVGKMCSFGYVLTDSDFNILESDDIVMNPECEFDWYLFSGKGATLAYDREYFRKQPSFPAFYEKIRSLLSRPDNQNFVFGEINDVGFVVTAVERYGCQWFDFSACNVEKIVFVENEIFGRLGARCNLLGIDNSDITEHKSQDDSVMTMRLLKAFCEKTGENPDQLVQKHTEFCFSAKDFLKVREKRLRKKARKEARKK